MFRKEFYLVNGTALLIFAAATWFAWHQLQLLRDNAKMLAVDSLPGLVDTGLAIQMLNDNEHAVQLLLQTRTAAEQAAFIAQIRTNNTEPFWKDYAASIFSVEDQTNYDLAMSVRQSYLQAREQLFALISAGKVQEAATFYQQKLFPLFGEYQNHARQMFAYNVREGTVRQQQILAGVTRTPLTIGVLATLTFVFGWLFGVRSRLSGLGKLGAGRAAKAGKDADISDRP